MEVTYDRVDMVACRREGITKPEQIIQRGPNETWMVPDGPVVVGQPVDWSLTKQGDYVKIPVIPYLLNKEPDLAMAFMLAIALNCAFELNHAVSRLHIVTGVPLEALPENPNSGLGLRLWIGFGVLLR